MGREAKIKRQRHEERVAKKRQFLERATEGQRRGCLFCRKGDGGFATREHPIPESLGNTDIVLENGVVCDRCNNGVLSDLDQAVTDFFPVSFRRAMVGIRTKAGKYPVAKFSGGTIQTTEPGHILLRVANEKHASTYPWGFKFSVTGQRLSQRRCRLVARSIVKAALECAWLDHGEEVLQPSYDHAREFVLGKGRRQGYLLLPKKGDPNDLSIQLTYWQVPQDNGETGLIVGVSYYGVFIGADTFNAQPPYPPPESLATVATF
jgi:HNH endonuclease